MVTVTEGKNARFYIDFAWEKDPHIRSFRLGLEEVFEGKYLETLYVPVQGQAFLLVGCGKEKETGLLGGEGNPGGRLSQVPGDEGEGMLR